MKYRVSGWRVGWVVYIQSADGQMGAHLSPPEVNQDVEPD
jgi:hypothetical protein